MGKIIQLNETLSNMIAAGEVVENMASVVKELTENALDANSKTITIHLSNFGLTQIKVIDDGDGMSPEDLLMAFKRHATSKIKTQHDLYHIASLGFRGEALPSIASVSELHIESTDTIHPPNKLILKNGEIIEHRTGTVKQGTIITVKNLFYNTPARLKHLKSEHQELANIINYVNKIALSHPFVRLSLTHNSKSILKTNGDGSILKILYQIYDHDTVKNFIYFENKNHYFTIKGYACKPAFTRSTRQHMTLLTNRRITKNQKVLSAILDGYKTYLPQHKYPIVTLYIEVDPLLIDVNIHPQKLDIKFTEEQNLLTLIKETIATSLQKENLIPQPQKHSSKVSNYPKMDFNEPLSSPQQVQEQETPISETKSGEKPTSKGIDDTNQTPPSKSFPDLEYIGQHSGTYLLFQNDQGLYLIDQHAAAERIRYENYYHAMAQGNTEETELLIPIKVSISNEEVIAFKDYQTTLLSFGLKTELVEDQAVYITHVPQWFYEGQEETYAEIMIRKLINEETLSIGVMIDQLAKDLACKHSIKANKYITKEEVTVLMKDLKQCKNPYTCPHGRPTIIHFTTSEIERMFKRIQS